MRIFYQLIYTFLFVLICQIAMAQPQHSVHWGCQHNKQMVPMKPLTPLQKSTIEESNARSDTMNLLNYNISLDITDFGGQTIHGSCEITMTPKFDNVDEIVLDLLNLDVDSVTRNNVLLDFEYDGDFVTIDLGQGFNINDTLSVKVFYGGHPTTASGGFGGLDFDGGIAYNLGIGLGEDPYNFGRGWFPCFDNFVERSTFDLNIISSGGRKAYCVGHFLGETDLGNGQILRSYRMEKPLPTYLVGVAVSNYEQVDYVHTGAYGEVPIQLVARPNEINAMENSFIYLDECIDAFESWFGPYAFHRAGFVLTPNGAMEHATMIAYPSFTGTSGANFANNRLMAHEFGHHWWGNITTLSSPANMWIKEGNAEYSAHLFTEYVFGKEEFIDQVKDNHWLQVLKSAHLDDGAYLQLSGIPFENTYGTHTYRKGASMMHNLRGYLGDTLFQQGMSSMLETYMFDAIDAEQFEEHLTTNTGIDVSHFMNAWIYNPGYSDYEVDSYVFIDDGNGGVNVDLTVQQKLHQAPNYHTNVPLVISFYGQNWELEDRDIMVSGELTDFSFNLPFEPVAMIINRDQKLNLGRMQVHSVVKEPGTISTDYIDQASKFIALETPDSALINVEHHYTAPDPANIPDVKMSSTHYWTISGIVPEGFESKIELTYNGSNENQFDFDLIENTEDSLVLMWRPNANTDWDFYPYSFYEKQIIGTGVGFGFIKIEPVLMGDYAFANADFSVDTKNIIDESSVNVYPNPASDILFVDGKLNEPAEVLITITDMNGKVVQSETKFLGGDYFHESFDLNDYPKGIYTLQIYGEKGDLMIAEKVTLIE